MIIQTNLLRYALHNLRRDGQRVFIALLCIAFGVMSLVAMTLMADTLGRPLLLDPRADLGGDLSLSRSEINAEQLAQLEAMQAQGTITTFTQLVAQNNPALRTPDSGELIFIRIATGIDPTVYPLVGELVLSKPIGSTIASLLTSPGDVLITRDLADEQSLSIGDTVQVSDLETGSPFPLTVTGIVADTPEHNGNALFYNLETAQQLAGSPTAGRIVVTAPDIQAAQTQLEAAGWQITTAAVTAARTSEIRDMMNLLLKGAGILGLLVGGIGIANTMQVLLARRTREVAILKTLGYSQRDMWTLFALEALLLGVAGSLLGMTMAVAVGRWLVSLASRMTTALLFWEVPATVLVAGLLVGIVTTLIFASYAIIRVSQVGPAALLRNEPVALAGAGRLQVLGLLLLLALPFAVMTTLVMGNLLYGVGILLFALAGLLVLGGLLGGILWLVVRLMPVGRLYLLRLARNSLRRRGWSLVFAMIAMFAGIVALGLATVTTGNAGREMDERTLELDGYNLAVISQAGERAVLEETLARYPLEGSTTGYEASVVSAALVGPDGASKTLAPTLIGRTELFDYEVPAGTWGEQPDSVYIFSYEPVPEGSQVHIALADGNIRSIPVAGSFRYRMDWPLMRNRMGVLMSIELLHELAEPQTVLLAAEVDASDLDSVSHSLGAALPQATVVNIVSLIGGLTQQYRNLYIFALAMSGLAMLAGMLLVANAVSLALLDRRYEIGVLKAIGYTQRHVLVAIALEYSLIALIASSLGVIALQIFLLVLSQVNNLVGDLFLFNVPTALLMVGGSVLLILLTAIGTAWGPTRVAPLVVLQDRG